MSFTSFHIIYIILQSIKSFDSHSFHSRVILMPFLHFLSFLYFDSHSHHLRLTYLILVSFLSFLVAQRGYYYPDPPFVPTLCQEYRLTIGLGGSGPTITSVSDRGGLWPCTGSDCTYPEVYFLINFASSLDLHKKSLDLQHYLKSLGDQREFTITPIGLKLLRLRHISNLYQYTSHSGEKSYAMLSHKWHWHNSRPRPFLTRWSTNIYPWQWHKRSR